MATLILPSVVQSQQMLGRLCWSVFSQLIGSPR